jgi:hypothetical protein
LPPELDPACRRAAFGVPARPRPGFATFAAVLTAACVLHGGPARPALAEPRGSYGRMSAAPEPRRGHESTRFVVSDAAAVLARHGLSAPRMTPPILSVDDFGARGDGVSDDSEAIDAALKALASGGTLVFTPERSYVKRRLLVLSHPGVKLWGYGATLYSIVSDEELDTLGGAQVAVHLDAPRTAVYGLTLVSNMRGRAVGHPHVAGIWLSSEDQEVIDNRLEYTNIFVRKAQRFVVARNVVYRSTADGIHVTTGSGSGKVVGNVVRETGDDMIAVVSYGLGEPNVGPVLVADNDVSGQYWGRGISVVGGHDVVIRNNRISRTPFGAAILVHSETSYKTSNVRNVRVESNQIRDVQTQKPAYNPARRWKKTGHGAIDVYGQGNQEVSQVYIANNSIEDADKDAILVRGNSCGIDILENRASGVGRDAVRIEVSSRPDCRIDCRDNETEGAGKQDGRCTSSLEAKR